MLEDDNYQKLSLNKVRRSLIAGMDLRASGLRMSREKMLIMLFEKEFMYEEREIIQAQKRLDYWSRQKTQPDISDLP